MSWHTPLEVMNMTIPVSETLIFLYVLLQTRKVTEMLNRALYHIMVVLIRWVA